MKKAADQAVNPFQGIIIAALTPRRPNETSIDLAATLELVDYLGRTGASAITLLGSTGEFVHFALDDRRHMTSFAAKRSRVPLLVNVSHSTLDGAVELAHEAEESGVGGVLVMPPYYFRYSQAEVRQFYLEFARAMQGRVPIYLYNIPMFTTEIAIATALELLDSGQFTGIKDSSGSWDYLEQLQKRASETGFSLLVGSDSLYGKARQMGADGAVSGVACAVPELMLAIEEAVAEDEPDRAAALSARVQEFVTQIARFPFPMGIKEAARLRKLDVGAPATALGEQAARDLEAFRAWFHPWLASVLGECASRVKAG